MKFIKTLSVSILILSSILASSQDPVNFTERINKGIYRTFSEFKANQPSIRDSFELTVGDSRSPVEVMLIDSLGVRSPVTGSIWGLYDGHHFYVKTRGLNQLNKPGRYSVFEVTRTALIGTNRGTEELADYILNYQTGEIVPATERNILKILSDDSKLFDDFRKNGNRELVYIYMDKYNKKHPIEYPVGSTNNAEPAEKQLLSFPQNSFYLESPGSSYLFGSLNFERLSTRSGNFYLMSRLGVGYGWINHVNRFTFPLMINGVFQLSNTFALEAGIGVTIMYQFWTYNPASLQKFPTSHFDPVLTGFAGIRFQREDGVLFRAGFTPLVDILIEDRMLDSGFIPWFGLSIGYAFGN